LLLQLALSGDVGLEGCRVNAGGRRGNLLSGLQPPQVPLHRIALGSRPALADPERLVLLQPEEVEFLGYVQAQIHRLAGAGGIEHLIAEAPLGELPIGESQSDLLGDIRCERDLFHCLSFRAF
jgi:hypothetical protein